MSDKEALKAKLLDLLTKIEARKEELNFPGAEPIGPNTKLISKIIPPSEAEEYLRNNAEKFKDFYEWNLRTGPERTSLHANEMAVKEKLRELENADVTEQDVENLLSATNIK